MSVINIPQSTISQIQRIADLPSEGHEKVLNYGILILEGDPESDQLDDIASICGTTPEQIYGISQAVGSLFWEFAKGSQKESVMADILGQLSLGALVTEAVVKVYHENKSRIIENKKRIALSTRKFKDLTWRLDVELARRNVSVTTEPKFMLRFDFNSPSSAADDAGESLHLQADYANMKRMQAELGRALLEMQSPHCQRLARYIS